MGADYLRHVEGTGGYLVSSPFRAAFREAWFDPEFWGSLAGPVTRGGRGAAWFVSAPTGDFVLRHFCRGGLPGRFIRRDYVFTRADAVRSFAEFQLLFRLREQGLPVPEPIAAGYRKRGPLLYRAALIIRRIPGARPLADFAGEDQEPVWTAAGQCIRRFHDASVFHADLNCLNILVADEVYLIDFDRGRIVTAQDTSDWRQANLNRLRRSVDKCLGHLDHQRRDWLWNRLLTGYRAQ